MTLVPTRRSWLIVGVVFALGGAGCGENEQQSATDEAPSGVMARLRIAEIVALQKK